MFSDQRVHQSVILDQSTKSYLASLAYDHVKKACKFALKKLQIRLTKKAKKKPRWSCMMLKKPISDTSDKR